MPREKILCGKEEIFRVAIDIVEQAGMADLSMRAIAKALGVSPMTIYNYVENLQAIKKRVLITAFDRLYELVYSELNKLTMPVDKTVFCKTVAMSVYKFSAENKNMFAFMFSDGCAMFSNDAEVKPFYDFISKLTQRAKSTQKSYATNEQGYKLLEILIFSVTYQFATGVRSLTEKEYSEYIDYYLKKCIS
jgi:AcrR family transcriptional regulator